MENFARDVIVQLEFQDCCNSIVIIIGGRVVDVCLGGIVGPLLAAFFRGFDSLELTHVIPPAIVPVVRFQLVRVDVRLPMRHCPRCEENKRHGPGKRVIEEERRLVCLEVGRQNFFGLQIRHLARSQRGQLANPFMETRICSDAEKRRHFRPSVGEKIMAVPQFMMGGKEPFGVWLDALQRTNVMIEIDVVAPRVSIFLAVAALRHRI